MFKPKAQEFRKQIRRQYLNEYFKKKRKEFNLIPQKLQKDQEREIAQISQKIKAKIAQDSKMHAQNILNLQQLEIIGKFTQIQLGVQCLSRTQIPLAILPYLSPQFYNTSQQHLVTCIFANITYLKPATCPTHQFMRNITNIIENTDMYALQQEHNEQKIRTLLIDTVDNCLMIIYNLVVEFSEAIEFYIQECNLVGILFGMCQGGLDTQIADKVLKIMTRVTAYHKGKSNKSIVKKFLKHYISILENASQNIVIYTYLSLANIKQLLTIYAEAIQPQNNFVKSYEISLGSPTNIPKFNETEKQLQEIITRIEKSSILSKLTCFYPYGVAYTHVTRMVFLILRIMLAKMEKKTVEDKLFKLLNRIIDAIYMQNPPNHENQSFIIKKEEDRQLQKNLIKTEFYQIIYAFLKIWPNDHQILVQHPLYEKICTKYEEFEETNKNQNIFTHETRVYFIHIFGLLAFSGKLNQHMKYLLGESLKRYRESQVSHNMENHSEEHQEFEYFISLVEQELRNGSQDFEM